MKQTLFLGLCAIVLLCGCTAEQNHKRYIKDGRQYGIVKSGIFRHRWWNYYERGRSFADGGYFAEALADFQAAIKQRSKGQRRARTYGMHFIDYHPHREMGIVYFQQGLYEDAETALAVSVNHYPTARAYFYLDKARQKRLEGISPTTPQLQLDVPSSLFYTRDDPVMISGVATDNNYIKHLYVHREPVFLESALKRVEFTKALPLPQGRHAIQVKAENLLSKTTTMSIELIVDREGPTISFKQLDVHPVAGGNKMTIAGAISDLSRVSSLTINGHPIHFTPQKEITFKEIFYLSHEAFVIEARDMLGNQTAAKIDVKALKASPTGEASNLYLAFNAGFDSYADLLAFIGKGAIDHRPPFIEIKGLQDRQTVFCPRLYIEGRITDQSPITEFLVNDQPVLKHQGKLILFNQIIDLHEGENHITLYAKDTRGNISRKTITVIRNIPKALRIRERHSVVVIPFTHAGRITPLSKKLQSYLTAALVEQHRFRVLERSELEAILAEHQLSQSKLVEQETALKMGRLIAAQSILVGSINRFNKDSEIEIILRMIDTETSAIRTMPDVYGEYINPRSLKKLSQGLVIKLYQKFPLIEGAIINKKGSDILTNLGAHQLNLDWKLIVYRESPPGTSSATTGFDHEILAKADTVEVMDSTSRATLDDRGRNAGICQPDCNHYKVIPE
jgi:hypothetical protein